MALVSIPSTQVGHELLREDAAARLLGISVRCLEGWRAKCIGPPFLRLTSRAIRYQRSDLLAWIESRRVSPAGAKK